MGNKMSWLADSDRAERVIIKLCSTRKRAICHMKSHEWLSTNTHDENTNGCTRITLGLQCKKFHPVWFDYAANITDISVVNFWNLPVYKHRDIFRRGLSWAVSPAEQCPEPARKAASYPLIKTFCLAVCRGHLPPCELSASREATVARSLLPNPRSFDWSSHRNFHYPLWNCRAGCGLSSPSPVRTWDVRLPLSPCRRSPKVRDLPVRSPLCFSPELGKA